jgi:hypothetical protein
LVNVAEADCREPTVTLPNASLAGLLVSCPAVTPVPVSGIASVGFPGSEVIVKFPLAEPAACGAKITVNDVLCPAARVSGVAIPFRLNAVPLTAACEIVTLAALLFVTVSEALCCIPTVTLPNA